MNLDWREAGKSNGSFGDDWLVGAGLVTLISLMGTKVVTHVAARDGDNWLTTMARRCAQMLPSDHAVSNPKISRILMAITELHRP